MKRRIIVTHLVVLLCCSLFHLACSEDKTIQPTPDPPAPKTYKIAFSWDVANDEHDEIYTIKPDGTELTRLTITPATSSCDNPLWSPDGQYIYYKDFMDEENEIFRMNAADGTGKTNLTQYPDLDALCDISPDGTKMAFVSDREGGTQNIFVMDLDGMTTLNITEGDEFEGRTVRFTPDGRRLLYSAGSYGDFNLCLEGIDGTGKTVLSNLTYDDVQGMVSPNGQKIAYISQGQGAAHNNVWVCDIDGSNRDQITASANDRWEPSWSPNSQKVIFTEILSIDTTIIVVVNADGTNPIVLTDSTATDHSPAWSPDGRKIVYISATSRVDAKSELFIMNADGSGKLQLTDTFGAGAVYYPAWSPGL